MKKMLKVLLIAMGIAATLTSCGPAEPVQQGTLEKAATKTYCYDCGEPIYYTQDEYIVENSITNEKHTVCKECYKIYTEGDVIDRVCHVVKTWFN